MPKLPYGKQKRWSQDQLGIVANANTIIDQYEAQGFTLTLRQLYYQFVARGLIANRQQEYKRLGSIINDARMAGLIDWEAIEDRTRNLEDLAHWESPDQIIRAAAKSFRQKLWETQPYYCEVWIEKDALKGVIEPTCEDLDVPYFSCRGYTSASEVWGASQRLVDAIRKGKKVRIFHLGDHDPSGIDMTRDISERLYTFVATDLVRSGFLENDDVALRQFWHDGDDADFNIVRLALNMDQVEEYDPPPNPAKITDSRARAYIVNYGRTSWELDALEPPVIDRLIRDAVNDLLDYDAWNEAVTEQERQREALSATSARWNEVVEFVGMSE